MIDLPERKYPLKRSKHSNHDKPDDKKFIRADKSLTNRENQGTKYRIVIGRGSSNIAIAVILSSM